MALGAVEAVYAAGKGEQVTMIGVDGNSDAVKSIKAGRLNASVAQLPYLVGKQAVENVKKALAGEQVPADIAVPDPGADQGGAGCRHGTDAPIREVASEIRHGRRLPRALPARLARSDPDERRPLPSPASAARAQRGSVGACTSALVLVVLIALSAVMAVLSPFFLSFSNFLNILLATSTIGVLAIAATYVIGSGGIDLSLGSVHGPVGRRRRLTWRSSWEPPPRSASLACIAAGAFAGYINGVLITRAYVPAFIVTLGMLGLARGLALVISERPA